MHLVIDTTGKKIFSFAIDPGHAGFIDLRSNFFYPAIFNKQVGSLYTAFIDNLYILYQVILHNLSAKSKPKPIPMQFKQTLVRLAFIIFPLSLFSQTTYIPFGDKSNWLIERLEIKNKQDSVLNFSKTRPFNRARIVETFRRLYEHPDSNKLSTVDRYNLGRFWINNIEFLQDKNRFNSRNPWVKGKLMRRSEERRVGKE